ncbi:hypothetical protein E4U44_000406, partial [Claviceps purpurea]
QMPVIGFHVSSCRHRSSLHPRSRFPVDKSLKKKFLNKMAIITPSRSATPSILADTVS